MNKNRKVRMDALLPAVIGLWKRMQGDGKWTLKDVEEEIEKLRKDGSQRWATLFHGLPKDVEEEGRVDWWLEGTSTQFCLFLYAA